MHVEFAPVDQNYLKDSVKTGKFRTEAEAVRNAVRAARQQEDDDEKHRLALLAALKLGDDDIAAGRVKAYTNELFEQIKQNARTHAAEGRKLKTDAVP